MWTCTMVARRMMRIVSCARNKGLSN
jgi:hypothetical protein